MKIKFKTKIDKQIEASSYWIDNTTEQILYGGAKGGGKSYLGASLIFGDALIYPETHYFIARQELTDLRKYTVPTIYEVISNWGLKAEDYLKFDGQYNVFTLYNKSKVFLIACKELPSDPMYERFGSMQMTRGWIEEGGEVTEDAKSNLWLSIGRWKNDDYNLKKKLLITANPKKGWMKREFVDPVLTPEKKYIQAFATDNLYLPTDYLETLKNEKNLITRQRLWKGDWDYDEDLNSIVNYEAIEDIFSNTVEESEIKYFVADLARLGGDKIVYSCWKGLSCYRIEVRQRQGLDITENEIRDILAEEKIPFSHCLVDEGGLGGGIVDNMRGIKGFVSNSSPMENPNVNENVDASKVALKKYIIRENYSNLKSQCGYILADKINNHEIAVKCEDRKMRDQITEELEQLRAKDIDTDKKHELICKDEMKRTLGRSPDFLDTILMRMFFELQKVGKSRPNKFLEKPITYR